MRRHAAAKPLPGLGVDLGLDRYPAAFTPALEAVQHLNHGVIRVHAVLDHQDVFHDQVLQVGTEEHVQRVGRRADHRFATTVERGVQGHAVTGQHFQLFHHVVVARVVFALEHLGTGSTVFVHHFRYTGLPLFGDFKSEGHERRRVIDLDHLWGHGVEHRREERPPALAELDLVVDAIRHAGCTWATDDRTTAQRTRVKLHAALEPGYRIAVDHDLGNALRHVLDLAPVRLALVLGARANHVFVAVGR